jgi:hypothetical protein
MDVGRGEQVKEFVKELTALGKNIMKPTTIKVATKANAPGAGVGVGPSRLPKPVEGSWFLRMLMYFIAGVLVIGLVLLAVDNWVTPIFQRKPGGTGYIPIPGTDTSEVFWKNNASVTDITIGSPPKSLAINPALPAPTAALSSSALEGQSNYSLTMDIYIANEYPQSLGSDELQRVFFMLGPSVSHPTMQVSLDNTKNTAYITVFNSEGLQESVDIENVPIHKPFRIGIVKSPYVMEGYLNGLLVMTRQLRSISKVPTTGDKIYAPANIIVGTASLSSGIKVMNVRTFGYNVSASEMKGRMNDLLDVAAFVGQSTARY